MTAPQKIPVLDSNVLIARLRDAARAKSGKLFAMYSSLVGGIITDPALMVLPLDDHMVHRGHGVFDTASSTPISIAS
jgi:4-amino-4-deoxychorismate lyase